MLIFVRAHKMLMYNDNHRKNKTIAPPPRAIIADSRRRNALQNAGGENAVQDSLIKLINNSWGKDKENQHRDGVWIWKHLHKIMPTFISIFSLNTDLFEMLYQTLGSVFHQDIQTPRRCCFNTLPRVWYITSTPLSSSYKHTAFSQSE